MSLVSDKSVQFGLYWRCSTCKSEKVSTKVMIRDGTFLKGQNSPFKKTLLLAADWIESPGRSAEATSNLFQVNRETVIQVHRSFRQLTEQWVAREMRSTLKLGGAGKIVELDESHMFKAKHHRGRMLSRKAVWIFGMIERNSNKVLMFQVAKRDAATLLPLIKEHVLNGTMVVSDGWSTYGGIPQIQANFTHRWVNHKVNFVNPADRRVHTQSIEATWGAFKRELKAKFGILDENLGEYMAVYMFRRYFKRERLFNHLLIEMKTFGRRGTPMPTTTQSPSDDSSQDDEKPIEENEEDTDGRYRSESESSDESEAGENWDDEDNMPSDDQVVSSTSYGGIPEFSITMESDSENDSDDDQPPPEKKRKHKQSVNRVQVTVVESLLTEDKEQLAMPKLIGRGEGKVPAVVQYREQRDEHRRAIITTAETSQFAEEHIE